MPRLDSGCHFSSWAASTRVFRWKEVADQSTIYPEYHASGVVQTGCANSTQRGRFDHMHYVVQPRNDSLNRAAPLQIYKWVIVPIEDVACTNHVRTAEEDDTISVSVRVKMKDAGLHSRVDIDAKCSVVFPLNMEAHQTRSRIRFA